MKTLIGWFMVFNTTFNNISDIMAVSFIGGENHWPVASHWPIYDIMLYRIHLAWVRFELTTLVVIGTDCTGSWKANYHTITTAPRLKGLFTNVYTYNENLEDHLTKKCLMLYSSIKLVLNYLNIYPVITYIIKRKLNSDGRQFHQYQYQQNEQ